MISKVIFLLSLCVPIILGNKTLSFTKGVVEVTDCGSESATVQLRVDPCSSVPCELTPESHYVMQIDFVASASHGGVSLILTVIQADGTETIVFESLVGGGGIEEGRQYTLTYDLIPNDTLLGELFDIRLEIIQAIDNYKEVCVEAPFTVI